MADSSLLLQAAVAAYIRGEAAQRLTAAKDALAATMNPGDRSYAQIGGDTIATVSRGLPRRRPAVVDEEELIAWARTNRPDAIVEKLADWFASPTNLEAMIEETGEVPDGVAYEAAPSRVSVRVSATQAENIRILLAQGHLTGIPSGEEKR